MKKADINQKLLDKSTLKLIGLNYTNLDIEEILNNSQKKIKEKKKKERAKRDILDCGSFFDFYMYLFFDIV